MTPLILEQLGKGFDDKSVLKDVSLTLESGSVLGLLGRNGAGKSTLIKCALGLLLPDRGKVRIFGESGETMSGKVKHRIGYVPQSASGFGWMKARALTQYIGAFYENWDQKRVDDLIHTWDLDPKDRVGKMSEGQRQKLAIIIALGHDPDLLILDEPVAGLDPSSRRKFIKHLLDMNIESGKTVLFSTHITSDLERVAAQTALLRDGVIYYQGDLDTLKEQVYKVHITADKDIPEDYPWPGVLTREHFGNRVTLTLEKTPEEALAVLAKQLEARYRIEYLSLEDIFLALNQ